MAQDSGTKYASLGCYALWVAAVSLIHTAHPLKGANHSKNLLILEIHIWGVVSSPYRTAKSWTPAGLGLNLSGARPMDNAGARAWQVLSPQTEQIVDDVGYWPSRHNLGRQCAAQEPGTVPCPGDRSANTTPAPTRKT